VAKNLNSVVIKSAKLLRAFPISAEKVIKDSKKMVKQSLDRKPETRREKIISLSKQKKEFGISGVLKILPDVPERTLRRDLESLIDEKKLKSKGSKKTGSI
jgi:predicted HTH transcriptional regulator